ncbi:cysteine desulfurase [Litoreibacter ponti]|uniref:Cysteine desulfurase n=1 Tax=Litoreibacter ponti TaxID=1510457 RepID=A0A2T6BIG3_9RHOB|nr:cysteine desulfurase family protein [Litoreibacter ponti]PTX55842.1 cysteine desulfurase [Litoreibacter ponti]
MARVYLDYNATAPLRTVARDAMIAAMDVVGNPSSVHAEGRAAKGLIERARAQISDAFGASGADIIFTSSATEAADLGLYGGPMIHDSPAFFECAEIEHDAVIGNCMHTLATDRNGRVEVSERVDTVALQLANSETGVIQNLPHGLGFSDMTQAFGKIPCAFSWTQAQRAIISAHKIGGPKGVGALVIKQGTDVRAQIKGGGQEMGRRSGTENVIGIAGFGAAAAAAAQDLADGVWDRVAELRNILEKAIEARAKNTIFVGKGSERLPNTSCFATPGWKGETQVMAMDLAGFAVSAGSACSSGKVKASRVVTAMGYDALTASSTLRVSLGPETTEEQVLRFADAWLAAEQKFHARAA